jgi:Xaa-Pro aminopeptidase
VPYKTLPHEEIRLRVTGLQNLLQTEGFHGALVVQKVDLYYLSGTDQEAHLWVPESGEPLLMVRKSMERALEDAAIDHIVPLTSLSEIPRLIGKHDGGTPGIIGLEMDVLPVNFFNGYRQLFPDAELADVSPLIRRLRMRKSPYELDIFRRGAALADRLLEKIPEFIRESETDTDLVLRAEAFYRSQGHPGLSRVRGFNMETLYGHLIAGPSGARPSTTPGPTAGTGPGPFLSQGAGMIKLLPHSPILVDYTANVEGYLSDQTRIFSIGTLPEKLERAHEVMIEVQNAMASEGKPGIMAKALYGIALEIVEEAGLTEGFMGHPQPVPFVGHGVGLELDEWPIIGRGSDFLLEQGMVIALEPKMVFPGQGVVGVESTFTVREKGLEKLNRFPDDVVTV